jgi:hypothetical protein
MNHKPAFLSTIIPVLGLVVVLGAAWGFDALTDFVRYRNAQTFSLTTLIMWLYSLIALCLAALLILLFWFTIIKAPRRVWVSLLYLLVGAFITVYPALYMTPAVAGWLPPLAPFQFSITMYLFSAGAFVAIMGAFSLILSEKSRKGIAR